MTYLLIVLAILIVSYVQSQNLPSCTYVDYDGRYYDFSGLINGTYGYTHDTLFGETYYFNICAEDTVCDTSMNIVGSSACMLNGGGEFSWINLGDYTSMELGQLPNADVTGQMGATLNYTTLNYFSTLLCSDDSQYIYTSIQMFCNPGQPTTISSALFIQNDCHVIIEITSNDACPYQNTSTTSSDDKPFECVFLDNSVAVLAPNKTIECKGSGTTICNSVDAYTQRIYMSTSDTSLTFFAPDEVQCMGSNVLCNYESMYCGFINGTEVTNY
ncbi:hypothetical protein DLAC_01723 [Tieghemostelium lacteum]|uniref:MRH domain-containing protein n=1 Tax=Tieghemostelium lacteum TaxID=361077 RepID=A0A152A653_TIELA|nr:hypothetical protein DLAC_01723 [Tieghemostelium lacteum]|eukprot:KYR01714.1 hypothetical protein DLAC_01723 [Tieghemostelium lacteum]